VTTQWHWDSRKRVSEGYEVETVFASSSDTERPEPVEEFDRFQDLAKKLVAAPKTELDEKLAPR
jgi:hypothetical protein